MKKLNPLSSALCSVIFGGLIKVLSLMPLRVIHFSGAWFGLVFHAITPKTRRILIDNLHLSGLYTDHTTLKQAAKINQQEMGKTMLESLVIWGSPPQKVLRWVKRIENETLIEDALKQSKGIIFLTPHLGAFEIAAVFYARTRPMTILYRPARQPWLDRYLVNGRNKGHITLAPTNNTGIKRLLMALKKGEAIGLLPDQLPNKGEGEWASFFGRPAYTMTLVSNLAARSGATVIMAVAERLPGSRGFTIHLQKIETTITVTELNAQLEQQIRRWPLQYAWNYHRFKQSPKAITQPFLP